MGERIVRFCDNCGADLGERSDPYPHEWYLHVEWHDRPTTSSSIYSILTEHPPHAGDYCNIGCFLTKAGVA